jgi:hypothetical protein
MQGVRYSDMVPDHPSYEQMRLAIETLCASPEPIRVRLLATRKHINAVNPSDLRDKAEWAFYHRIVAGLVEGGEESDEEADESAIAESLTDLGDARVIEIATDILHLFELVADINPIDAPLRWLAS